jgi:hypothetical protein
MNWRRGFFRAWALISIIWAIFWATMFLPEAESKIAMARLSDAELMAKLDDCKLPQGVPPPPQGFYLDTCLKRLSQEGRAVERWSGGNDLGAQVYRIAGALNVPVLIIPPIALLLFGLMLGWVFGGFRKNTTHDRDESSGRMVAKKSSSSVKRPWSLMRAAMWGLLVMLVVSAVHSPYPWPTVTGCNPELASYWIGYFAVGPMLFVVLAIIRNLTVRP